MRPRHRNRRIAIAASLAASFIACNDSASNGKGDAGRPIATTVELVDGVPQVFVDGVASHNLVLADLYHYRDNINRYELPYGNDWVVGVKAVIDEARTLGTEVIALPLWWNEIDKSTARPSPATANLDFSPIDEVLDHARMRGVYVALSPEIHKMFPRWWAEENGFPVVELDRDTSVCVPKDADATVSCIPKELCGNSQACCTTDTRRLYCCDAVTEPYSGPSPLDVVAKRLTDGMIACEAANGSAYASCDACATDAFGWKFPFQSHGNEKLRADYAEYLKVVVDRYANHPALFGWIFTLGAMGEDIYGDYTEMFLFEGSAPGQLHDYSAFFAREFRKWLRSKYGTDAGLEAAWGDAAATLDTATLPSPRACFKDGNAAVFPDDGYSRQALDALGATLTGKGLDFYQFREHMRDADRRFYIDIIDKADPHHIVIYGTPSNENVLENDAIDACFANPNLIALTDGDHYDVAWARAQIDRSKAAGKAMIYGAENGRGEAIENESQLAGLERFGKAVKCFGGHFGYVLEIRKKTNGERLAMPSWTSAGARRAIERIRAYAPEAGCDEDFSTGGGYCGDGMCEGPETHDNCPADCG